MDSDYTAERWRRRIWAAQSARTARGLVKARRSCWNCRLFRRVDSRRKLDALAIESQEPFPAGIDLRIRYFVPCSPIATSPRPSPPLRGGEGGEITRLGESLPQAPNSTA